MVAVLVMKVMKEGFILWFDNTRNRMHTPTINSIAPFAELSKDSGVYLLFTFK
jgi:hypothetical protein